MELGRKPLADADATMWREMLEPLRELAGGPGFLDAFDALAAGFMDVMYGTERLLDRPDLLLHTLLELAEVAPRDSGSAALHQGVVRSELEARLFDVIGRLATIAPGTLRQLPPEIPACRRVARTSSADVRDRFLICIVRFEGELARLVCRAPLKPSQSAPCQRG